MRTLALAAGLLAVAGVVVWRWAATPPEPWAEPVTADPIAAVVDGSRPGETGRVAFALTNRSGRRVTVTAVKCCCGAVLESDPRTLLLAPGETRELAVRFTVPDAGVRTYEVTVAHDASPAPLQLTAAVSGRRSPPHLLHDGFTNVPFFGPDSSTTTAVLSVVTCEPPGAPPWLGAATSTIPELTIERTGLTERRTGPLVERTYEYRLGWRAVPAAREFFGTVTATPTAPGQPAVVIGTVTGTRATAGRRS